MSMEYVQEWEVSFELRKYEKIKAQHIRYM